MSTTIEQVRAEAKNGRQLIDEWHATPAHQVDKEAVIRIAIHTTLAVDKTVEDTKSLSCLIADAVSAAYQLGLDRGSRQKQEQEGD